MRIERNRITRGALALSLIAGGAAVAGCEPMQGIPTVDQTRTQQVPTTLDSYIQASLQSYELQNGPEKQGLINFFTDLTDQINHGQPYSTKDYKRLSDESIGMFVKLYFDAPNYPQKRYQTSIDGFPGYKPSNNTSATEIKRMQDQTLANSVFLLIDLAKVLKNGAYVLDKEEGTIIVTNQPIPDSQGNKAISFLCGSILPAPASLLDGTGQGVVYAVAPRSQTVDKSRLPDPNSSAIAAARAQVRKAARIF